MTIAKQIIGTFSGMLNQDHALIVPDGKQITISTIIIANYTTTAKGIALWVEKAEDWWSETLTPEQLADFTSLDQIFSGKGGFLVPPAYIEGEDAKYLTLACTLGPKDRIRAKFEATPLSDQPPYVYISMFGSVEDRGLIQDVVIPVVSATV